MFFTTPARISLSPLKRRPWKQLQPNYNASRLFWSFISKAIELAVTRHLLSRSCNKIMQEEDFWLGCSHGSRQERISPQLFMTRVATNFTDGQGWNIYLPQLFSVTTRRREASFLLAPASSSPCLGTPHPLCLNPLSATHPPATHSLAVYRRRLFSLQHLLRALECVACCPFG